ncbi:MAG: ATP-dependent helicase C-terminal domain-containing protein, partial [Luteimonas sp.]
GLALELAAWGRADLMFIDAPPAGALSAARDVLGRLGALDGSGIAVEVDDDDPKPSASDRITPLGRRMLALGTHPRLAAMLLASNDAAQQALACDLVALVESRDPLRAQPGLPRSDALAARWRALMDFREGRAPAQASRPALAAIAASATQWRRRLRIHAQAPRDAPPHALGDLLAHAFPDRIARRHATDGRRYQLANGRIARLFDDSELFGEPWIVASELRDETKDALIVRGAPLDETYLRQAFAASFSERDEVRWDAARRALVAERVQRFDGIVLDARPAGSIDRQHAAQALTDAVATLGIDALPWSDALRQWRARARSLRAWMPELGLPDLSDEALLDTREAWLLPAFAGKTRFDALDEAEFSEALKTRVDWALRQRIEQLAPPRILVPSGQERRIEYAQIEDGTNPVLAVKLQELFGLADTPRIADGRVPLTIHLLSPAGRPLQVTQDLRGFWERTYPDVKKEMKGRYPKHPWPDDPWNATPTHRAKPRGDR